MWHRGPVSEGFWKPKGTACPNRMGKAAMYAGKAQQKHGVGDGYPLQKHAKQQNPNRIQGQGVRLQTWCPNSAFETANIEVKAKQNHGVGMVEWVGVEALSQVGHACETAEPHQDSNPRGGQFVCNHGVQTSPSRPLKTSKTMEWGTKALEGSDGLGEVHWFDLLRARYSKRACWPQMQTCR